MPFGLIEKLTPSDENLVDYILWTGAYDFQEYPFRDADALVLCMLSYFDMKMLFTDGRTEIKLKELLPFLENGQSLPQLTGPDGGSSDIARAACLSKRFGELSVRNHEDILQTAPPLQFAAMSFHDEGDMNFLAYRGTDSSLAGWKEDCMIAFTRTDAQKMAADYAKRVLSQADAWYMGGHSKGGNQVIFAAAQQSDEELEKVKRIYMLDGPGMCEDVYDKAKIDRIAPKVTRVIPEFDLIGKFFESDIADTRIIKSSNPEGLGQHALASWQVDHGALSRGEPSEKAEWTMRVVNDWIRDLPQDERKTLVDELFAALSVEGTKDLNEITLDRFLGVLIELGHSSEATKQNFIELPKKFLQEELPRPQKANKGLLRADKKDVVLGAVLVLLGGILCAVSSDYLLDHAAFFVMTVITGYQIFTTVKRIRERGGKSSGLRERMYFTIALIAGFIALVIKEDAPFIMGSLILGASFLALGYRESLYAVKARKTSHKVFYWVETAFCIIFGGSFLLIPQATVSGYSAALGIILILDGLIRLITLYLKNK